MFRKLTLAGLTVLGLALPLGMTATADAHPPDDPSFAQWPPHCVVGTSGQQRITETRWASPRIIPSRKEAFVPPKDWLGQIIIEKTDYDVSSNPNFDNILSALINSFGPVRFVVFGVATEYCVRAAALALRKHKFPVDVVVDAIKAITEEGGRVKFCLQSYLVGMYCAIYAHGSSSPLQTGDRNSHSFVRRLKSDLIRAVKRGATVEIGQVLPVISGETAEAA